MKDLNGKRPSGLALIPFAVFIVIYMGAGIYYQVKGMDMAFYQFPSVTAMFLAVLTAFVMFKGSINEKFETFAKGAANVDILTMLMIYILAGAFASVAAAMGGRESTVNLGLSLVPVEFLAAGLFVISAFMGTATGSSMGTVTAVIPIAVGIAEKGGLSLTVVIGAVVGGAMFGDNLSFISDTTIAACNGQGCAMKDKFRGNFGIALPAALGTLVLILLLTLGQAPAAPEHSYSLVQILPYVLVLAGGIAGINVFVVLLIGIVSGSLIMLATGQTAPTELLAGMGTGAAGMFETSMVAVLVAAMCSLIRVYGGFDALLYAIGRLFRGKRGGQLGIGLLVGAMDIATANNTVAIVMANPIAKEMSGRYGISSQRSACLLDTFSCIFQGIIPYGAQMLVAISATAELGITLSAFQIMRWLFYPYLLLISSLIAIFFTKEKD